MDNNNNNSKGKNRQKIFAKKEKEGEKYIV